MASGAVGGLRKYYFYAQGQAAGSLSIGEIILTDETRRMSVIIKATSSELGSLFLEALKEGLEDAFFIRDLEV